MNSSNFWINYKDNAIIKYLSQDFKCSVCRIPLVEPYLLSCSDHYCLQCKDELFSKQNKICNICNEVVDGLLLDKKIVKNLKQIEISCLNSKGCFWKGDLTIFENHCYDCLFQNVECEFNCGELITRNQLLNHKTNFCQERKITCEYCNLIIKSKNYTNHLDKECSDIPVDCPNQCKTTKKLKRKELDVHYEICYHQNISCFICNQIEKRSQMENHLNQNLYSHIMVLYNEITLLKKDKEIQDIQMSQIKQEIAQNQQEINENQKEFSKFKEVIQNLTIEKDSKEKELNKLKQDQTGSVQQFNNFDLKIDSLPKIILYHGSEVTGLLHFSEDLLISGGNKDIKFWDLHEYNLIYTIPDSHSSEIYSLKKLNEKQFISAGEDKSIKIWNVEKKESVKLFNIEHTDKIWDLLIISDKKIASASFDNMIKIWNPTLNNSIKTLNGHSHRVRSLIEMKEGEIISSSDDKTIRFWDLNKNKTNKIITQSNPILSLLRISNTHFASGSYKEIIIYDYPDINYLRTLQGHTDFIYDLILFDCNIIASASGSDDKSIKVWNVLTGEILYNLNSHAHRSWKLAKLNETYIASGTGDGGVIIWENLKKLK